MLLTCHAGYCLLKVTRDLGLAWGADWVLGVGFSAWFTNRLNSSLYRERVINVLTCSCVKSFICWVYYLCYVEGKIVLTVNAANYLKKIPI